MQRRKFLVGLGSLAASGAAVMGSGAFSAARADRGFSVNLTGDANGYLALEPADSKNADAFVSVNNNNLEIDISKTEAGGRGVQNNAAYAFDDLFKITNQGTSQVHTTIDDLKNNEEVVFYAQRDGTRDKIAGGASTVGNPPQSQFIGGKGGGTNAVILDAGDSVTVGVEVQGRGSTQDLETISIFAGDSKEELANQININTDDLGTFTD